MIRVELPTHLRNLAGVSGPVRVEVTGPATLVSVLEALEEAHPVLRGTIRPHDGEGRRPLLRFYAGRRDLSHETLDHPLPAEVVSGGEPLLVVGAIAGG